MEHSDIEHMAQGYPPAHIAKDSEEVIVWLATQLLATQEQRDALAVEVSAIREQAEDVYATGYRHGHVNTVDGIAYVTPVEDEFYHNALQVMLEVETPATDAYLNSVRADAVASFAHHQRVIADSETDPTIQRGHRITACRAEDFAAQIRAGKDGE